MDGTDTVTDRPKIPHLNMADPAPVAAAEDTATAVDAIQDLTILTVNPNGSHLSSCEIAHTTRSVVLDSNIRNGSIRDNNPTVYHFGPSVESSANATAVGSENPGSFSFPELDLDPLDPQTCGKCATTEQNISKLCAKIVATSDVVRQFKKRRQEVKLLKNSLNQKETALADAQQQLRRANVQINGLSEQLKSMASEKSPKSTKEKANVPAESDRTHEELKNKLWSAQSQIKQLQKLIASMPPPAKLKHMTAESENLKKETARLSKENERLQQRLQDTTKRLTSAKADNGTMLQSLREEKSRLKIEIRRLMDHNKGVQTENQKISSQLRNAERTSQLHRDSRAVLRRTCATQTAQADMVDACRDVGAINGTFPGEKSSSTLCTHASPVGVGTDSPTDAWGVERFLERAIRNMQFPATLASMVLHQHSGELLGNIRVRSCNNLSEHYRISGRHQPQRLQQDGMNGTWMQDMDRTSTTATTNGNDKVEISAESFRENLADVVMPPTGQRLGDVVIGKYTLSQHHAQAKSSHVVQIHSSVPTQGHAYGTDQVQKVLSLLCNVLKRSFERRLPLLCLYNNAGDTRHSRHRHPYPDVHCSAALVGEVDYPDRTSLECPIRQISARKKQPNNAFISGVRTSSLCDTHRISANGSESKTIEEQTTKERTRASENGTGISTSATKPLGMSTKASENGTQPPRTIQQHVNSSSNLQQRGNTSRNVQQRGNTSSNAHDAQDPVVLSRLEHVADSLKNMSTASKKKRKHTEAIWMTDSAKASQVSDASTSGMPSKKESLAKTASEKRTTGDKRRRVEPPPPQQQQRAAYREVSADVRNRAGDAVLSSAPGGIASSRRYTLAGIPPTKNLPKSLGDIALTAKISLRRFMTGTSARPASARITPVRASSALPTSVPVQRTRRERFDAMLRQTPRGLEMGARESVPEHLLRTMDLALRGVVAHAAVQSAWCTALQTLSVTTARIDVLLEGLTLIIHRSVHFRKSGRSDGSSATHTSRGRHRPWEDGETAMVQAISACVDVLTEAGHAPSASTEAHDAICTPPLGGSATAVTEAPVSQEATAPRVVDRVLSLLRAHMTQLVVKDVGGSVSDACTPARVGRVFGRLCRQYHHVAQLLSFAYECTCMRETFAPTVFIAVLGAFPAACANFWMRFPVPPPVSHGVTPKSITGRRPPAVSHGVSSTASQRGTMGISSRSHLQAVSIQLTVLRWLLTPTTPPATGRQTRYGARIQSRLPDGTTGSCTSAGSGTPSARHPAVHGTTSDGHSRTNGMPGTTPGDITTCETSHPNECASNSSSTGSDNRSAPDGNRRIPVLRSAVGGLSNGVSSARTTCKTGAAGVGSKSGSTVGSVRHLNDAGKDRRVVHTLHRLQEQCNWHVGPHISAEDVNTAHRQLVNAVVDAMTITNTEHVRANDGNAQGTCRVDTTHGEPATTHCGPAPGNTNASFAIQYDISASEAAEAMTLLCSVEGVEWAMQSLVKAQLGPRVKAYCTQTVERQLGHVQIPEESATALAQANTVENTTRDGGVIDQGTAVPTGSGTSAVRGDVSESNDNDSNHRADSATADRDRNDDHAVANAATTMHAATANLPVATSGLVVATSHTLGFLLRLLSGESPSASVHLSSQRQHTIVNRLQLMLLITMDCDEVEFPAVTLTDRTAAALALARTNAAMRNEASNARFNTWMQAMKQRYRHKPTPPDLKTVLALAPSP